MLLTGAMRRWHLPVFCITILSLLCLCMVSYGEGPLLHELLPQGSELPSLESSSPSAETINLYTVNFLGGDGSLLGSMTLPAGQPVPVPDFIPQATPGFAFSHWADVDVESGPFTFDAGISRDTVLQACFIQDTIETIANVFDIDTPSLLPADAFIADEAPSATIFAENILGVMPAPQRHVGVLIEADFPLSFGQQVTLCGNLTGYDDAQYALQWQYQTEAGWVDVPGGNALRHSFILDTTNAGYNWRLQVTVAS